MGVAARSVRPSGRARCANAFVAALFRRHRKRLLFHLKSLVPSLDEAEDVAQEAYLRLLNVDHLDEDFVRARSYLFKTATNLALDSRRRRFSRREHLKGGVDVADLAAEGPDPGRVLDEQHGARVVHGALRDLLPRTRTAFLLHWHADMSYRQIAAELGVSKKTVERDIALTLALCRSRMGDGSACSTP